MVDGKPSGPDSSCNHQKSTIASLLALAAVVAAAPGDDYALEGRLACQTRFPFSAIDPMLQLEGALFSVRVHIVRNRRTAQCNCFLQDFFHRQEKPTQLLMRDRSSAPARPNSSAKQGFIRVDVPHSPQQLLVEQCALDGSIPPVEQDRESVELNFQRLEAPGFKRGVTGHAEPPEASRVNKAQFPA